MKVVPLELRENWSEDSRGVLQGSAVWSDCREEPIGIFQGVSEQDMARILDLPNVMAFLVACTIAIKEDLKSGTLSSTSRLLPELEKKVIQLGVALPDVDNSQND
jgi:hypothetical protein